MYLKRLDVIGFKSFAERIGVDFVRGVTAVVGPNGSGKSNIIDAIRWVLGEQSAKSLRGTKMEDIIFAGSDSRKGLNFAEVTLTLDNEDQ
jgi:chromosome segregation protein